MENINNNEGETEILFLTRELRFAVNLILLALEETNKFDLVINDPAFLTFLLLSSQGVERLLKLSLSYNDIINKKTEEKFSAKKYGHSISRLYKKFKEIAPQDALELIKNMSKIKANKTNLFADFTGLLEIFNNQGRYYFTSAETRKKERFAYHFDEFFINWISAYASLKIYENNYKFPRYKDALKRAIEEAKVRGDKDKVFIAEIFCRNIGKEPKVPYWIENDWGIKMGADDKFKKVSRELLLLYIAPIVSLLEKQFDDIEKQYEMLYYFSELTFSIKNIPGNYNSKRHKVFPRDIYSEILL